MSMTLPHVLLIIGKRILVGTDVGGVLLILPLAQQAVAVDAQSFVQSVQLVSEGGNEVIIALCIIAAEDIYRL